MEKNGFLFAKKKEVNDEMLKPHFKKRLIKDEYFEGNKMKHILKVPDGKNMDFRSR